MFDFKGRVRSRLQDCLKCIGKGEKKIAGVFGISAASSHEAVLHLRRGAPDVPIWLFTMENPLPETEALCERVYRNENALALVAVAQRRLWPCWVAISVGTWTPKSSRQRGAWALKLAPFLVPPFRVLILNSAGGFFSGTPSNIFIHGVRTAREAIHNKRVQAQEAIHSAWERAQWAIHPARVRSGNLLRGLAKLSAATALRLTAILLRWMSNPHLILLRRLHGSEPLLLDVETGGEGLVHFRQAVLIGTATNWKKQHGRATRAGCCGTAARPIPLPMERRYLVTRAPSPHRGKSIFEVGKSLSHRRLLSARCSLARRAGFWLRFRNRFWWIGKSCWRSAFLDAACRARLG
jgi:hypothetical protein